MIKKWCISGIVLSTLLCLSFTTVDTPGRGSYDLQTVDAPFPMDPIRIFRFPQKEFLITDFGAKPGADFNNTKAIADAIKACNEAGGGRVIVPAGEWWTGPIHFRSNVDLHLEEGATVRFTDRPADYLPAVMTSWEGMECYNYSPLVYAFNCENIAITGKGILQPKMDTWKKWFPRPQPHLEALKKLYTMASTGVPVEQRQMAEGENNLRPHLIQFNRCKNVLLEDFQIRESPFWTIHMYMCDGGVARNLDVKAHGHNNDGIDLEMTRNFLVENCIFDQGDDAVVIKAGRDRDAWRLDTPCENIVIRNCTVLEGHTLLGIGSEMSGGVRNVYMHDCTAPNNVDRFFFIKTNHGRGGFVENIYMENVHSGTTQSLLEIDTDVFYQWKNLVPTYETRMTRIDNIVLRNVTCDTTNVVYELKGDARLPIQNVEISNVKVGKVNKQVRMVENAEQVTEKKLQIGTEHVKSSPIICYMNKKEEKPFFFSTNVSEGNYFVKVTLGNDSVASVTTVKAESRRLMLLNVQTRKGEYLTRTFAVNIRNPRINETASVKINKREIGSLTWDDQLTLEFNGVHPSVSKIEITPVDTLPVIFLAGNSTMVDQGDEPWCGWGQAFTCFLSPEVVVANYAESGLSAGSFIAQKRFDKLLTQMKPGDYVFIEFGHNDEKEKGEGDGPYASYKRNLKFLVDKTRAQGGIPVLITPMHRRRFDENGKIVDTHGEYPDAMRQLAKEENVTLIDLTSLSKTLFEAMGVTGSIRAFVHYPAGTFPNQKTALADNTHFNFYGGYEIAQCILKGIIDNHIPLKKYILKPYGNFNPAHPDDVNTFVYPPTPFFEQEKPEGN